MAKYKIGQIRVVGSPHPIDDINIPNTGGYCFDEEIVDNPDIHIAFAIELIIETESEDITMSESIWYVTDGEVFFDVLAPIYSKKWWSVGRLDIPPTPGIKEMMKKAVDEQCLTWT